MADTELLIANAGLAAEEFDREIVLLDVVRGLYFSLGGAAVDLWRAFGEPRGADEAIEALCLRFPDADRPALKAAVQGMRHHGLLVKSEASFGSGRPAFTPAAREFHPPTVEAFSDLADLISIDPVHEVDSGAGWPVKPDNFPDAV
jgi:hypothetical protein